MTAVTSNLDTPARAGSVRAHPIAAATALYAGILIALSTTGYAVSGVDTAGYKFVGVARAAQDNSAGAAGALDIEVYKEGVFSFAIAAVTQADIGRDVYIVDNATVGFSESVTKRVRVGKIVAVDDSTHAWVQIDTTASRDGLRTFLVVGPNATDFDFTGAAAEQGGSDFYVDSVIAAEAYVAATGASAGLKKVTTDWTLAAGVLTAVGDESANVWVITALGHLV